MCGRFTQAMSWRELVELYRIHEQPAPTLTPRFNVAPTQSVLAIRADKGRRQAFLPRWGLVPAWAKDIAIGSRMINARAESLAEKPAFRTAFRQRRCLIPASGLYEWSGPRSARQPHYIRAPERSLLTSGGLWQRWRDPAVPDAPPLESCTIITTTASSDVIALHDRMPLLLAPEDWEVWLDPDAPAGLLETLLRPAPPGSLSYHPVDRKVGSPRVEGPELIEPLARPPEQLPL